MNSDQKKTLRQGSSGLSLIELLVVLAIIAVLAGTALVYINTDGYRLRAEANNLKSTLQEARMEAVKRNTRAYINLYVDMYTISLPDQDDKVLASVKLPNELELEFNRNPISFQPLGTSGNYEVVIKNNKQHYSLIVRTAGRIFIEGPKLNNENI